MPQSLTQLPKKMEFAIAGWDITIEDHKIVDNNGLLNSIMHAVDDPGSDRNILYEFEKHGVSFEMVIEYCVWEIENDEDILADVMWYMNVIMELIHTIIGINMWSECRNFSKSVKGREISEQYTEKIRSCNNWEELYDEMQQTSKFHRDMKKRMNKEIKIRNKTKEEVKE